MKKQKQQKPERQAPPVMLHDVHAGVWEELQGTKPEKRDAAWLAKAAWLAAESTGVLPRDLPELVAIEPPTNPRRFLEALGVTPVQVTLEVVRAAEVVRRARANAIRESWIEHNRTAGEGALRVVVPGDADLDSTENAQHPLNGEGGHPYNGDVDGKNQRRRRAAQPKKEKAMNETTATATLEAPAQANGHAPKKPAVKKPGKKPAKVEKKGLRDAQVRILKVAAKLKGTGFAPRRKLLDAAEVKTQGNDVLGSPTSSAAQGGKDWGFPSLLDLKYVQAKEVDVDGKKTWVYGITEKGKKALEALKS